MVYILKKFLHKNITLKLLIISISFIVGTQTAYAVPPAGFQTETVIAGFDLPTSAQYAPDGRIFVAEKGGAVKIVRDGVILPTPFYQLTNVNTYGDNGLIGMALDPNFSVNGYVYLSYVYDSTPGLNNQGPKTGQVIRITANGNVAVAGSEVVLIGSVVGDALNPSCTDYPDGTDCIASDHSAHTTDSLAFGLDGKLYVSIGDGADFNGVDPLTFRAQNLDSLNGKVLRINTDGTAPVDNPFYNGNPNANRSKVWYYGLRNPFRLSVHPSTGKIYVGDVGWFSFEEVNFGDPGSNFGWPCREGMGVTPSYNCSVANTINPLYSYPHDLNGAGSITGGIFYTGNSYPSNYNGQYFFGDYSQNWIKTLQENSSTTSTVTDFMLSGADGPVYFFADSNGDINYISIYTGSINKITYTTGNRTPIAVATSSATSGLAPLQVSFDGTGSNDPDNDSITFVWDFGDGATSTATTTSHTYTNNGTYLPTLTVTDSYGATSTMQMRIIVGNIAPTATIVNPPNNSFYVGGQYIPLVGSATDFEDGILPESAYTWRIILHHNVHIHVIDQKVGSNVIMLTESHGDPTEDVYIEAELTVTDSVGLSTTTSIFLRQALPSSVLPYLSGVTLSNNSPIINSPLTITAMVGNSGTSSEPILVDLELFDASGNQVAQSFYNNQSISSSTVQSFLLNWTPTVAGDYRLAVGLIRVNWTGLYEWIPDAATFTVNATTTATTTSFLGGALNFDGVDDYADTENWDIEENTGFTLEARFQANSITKDMHLISKEGALTGQSLWTLGIAHNTVGSNTLRFELNTNGVNTVLDGGSVVPDEVIHASAVFDGVNMLLYKNGILVASTPKVGQLTTNPAGMVWIGDNPTSPTLNTFDGEIDEMRVWNLPRTAGDILTNSNKELDLTLSNYGLIKYWKMNEGFGQDIIDSSNSGHHGILGSTLDVDINDPFRVGTGFASPGGIFTPTHTSLINTTQTVVGAPITFTETVTNSGDGAGYVIVDLEIYDQTNNRVFQRFYDGAGFLPGVSRDFTFTWTPTAVGNFRVAIGLIRLHWSGAYQWINQAGVLNVTQTPTIDTINPVSVITSPLGSATVSSTTTVLVNATDNVGVAGVTLLLDGVVFGVEDTLAPYSFIWNTASSTNASHTLVARARDTSGNLGTSTAITVIVNNSIATTSGPFAPTLVSVTATPEQVNPGTPVTISATINNPGVAGSALIDLEVYQNGVKVGQRFFDNELFAEGETRTFTWDWIPNLIGQFGLAIGILEPSWAGLYEWNSPPIRITVSDVISTTTPSIQVYYDNVLESGWSSWSWDATTNFVNPINFTGSTSLSVTFTNIWGGLYLRHTSFSTSGMTSLKFAVSGATVGNQRLQVLSLDSNGVVQSRVLLSNYINPLLPNQWQQVSIPLVDLGVGSGSNITGFIVQGSSGLIEPEFYLDNIRLEP